MEKLAIYCLVVIVYHFKFVDTSILQKRNIYGLECKLDAHVRESQFLCFRLDFVSLMPQNYNRFKYLSLCVIK